MNIRDLKYLVAVAELKHFGHAADACHVSQPTLSTQLKKLEETLGVVVIERTNRQVLLSGVGEKIVLQAKRVLSDVDELMRIADQHRDPFGGDLRLGIIPTVAPYLLSRILGPIRKRFPKLRIQLNEGQTADISARLKLGELDAIILALPLIDDQTEVRTLYREPFYFTLSTQHPLAGKKQIAIKDLADERMLLLEDGHCLRDQALSACGVERDDGPGGEYAATSLHTLAQMVAGGLGVTVLPELAIKAGLTDGTGIVLRPIAGDGAYRTLGFAWRPGAPRAAEFRALAPVLAGVVAG